MVWTNKSWYICQNWNRLIVEGGEKGEEVTEMCSKSPLSTGWRSTSRSGWTPGRGEGKDRRRPCQPCHCIVIVNVDFSLHIRFIILLLWDWFVININLVIWMSQVSHVRLSYLVNLWTFEAGPLLEHLEKTCVQNTNIFTAETGGRSSQFPWLKSFRAKV